MSGVWRLTRKANLTMKKIDKKQIQKETEVDMIAIIILIALLAYAVIFGDGHWIDISFSLTLD
jgi:hypothetical protein